MFLWPGEVEACASAMGRFQSYCATMFFHNLLHQRQTDAGAAFEVARFQGLKYQKTSEFIKKETLTASYQEQGPSGEFTTMTTINLKRKADESLQDDGTHISCRFLDEKGGCSMHPDRPGVCYLYPFSTWLENEKGTARVHATYQFTGDCPGFYLEDNLESMKQELRDYSKIIYDYNMASNRTNREGFGSVSFG